MALEINSASLVFGSDFTSSESDVFWVGSISASRDTSKADFSEFVRAFALFREFSNAAISSLVAFFRGLNLNV